MSEKSWVDILRENIEAATPRTMSLVRSYINEIKLMRARENGTEAEIAEAEYNVHRDEGGEVH